ncbi:uncharacterized protein LOC127122343 [Lathyrus oleraceus]|uniref:uncharacterized protein LOC127122343 n=1 Tax=Pisum sativum TaxID=3888 RepID=UPI0021CFC285|nr:uncharacterized protein LOC127122343 [Pisum sativum]
MEEKETTNDFITRIIRLVNQVKACRKMVIEQYVVAKILHSLTPRFDNVVVAIEESKDLATMRKDELQISLKAHKQKMEERNCDSTKAEIILQARFNMFDRFARECNINKKEPQGDEAKVAIQEFDEENTLLIMITEGECSSNRLWDSNNSSFENTVETCCNQLRKSCNQLQVQENVMMSTKGAVQCNKEWYLDSGCSTHMKGRKDWFVKINCAMKNKVKFTDVSTLVSDGINDVLIMIRDDGHSLIKDILYIPGIKCNLLSIGKLLEKG